MDFAIAISLCYNAIINKVMSKINVFFKEVVQITAVWPLFFIVFIVVFNLFFLNHFDDVDFLTSAEDFGYGGPVSDSVNYQMAVLGDWDKGFLNPIPSDHNLNILTDGAISGFSDPLTNLLPARYTLHRYKVQKGDTLGKIAAEFGLTIDTLRQANPGVSSYLKVGQDLVILPVSGSLYEVKKDDTLDSISLRYKVSQDLIKQYNPDYQKILASANGILVLPYVKLSGKTGASLVLSRILPNLKNYFVLPAQGWNWGELHNYNAVDIANRCGTPVYAAAEGLVIPDDELGDGSGGWNNGYGIFVLIEHPNGTRTRYAHLGKVLIKIGDYVSEGDQIGVMGNTGMIHGPTGCHLHFEVYGAKNPFAVK